MNAVNATDSLVKLIENSTVSKIILETTIPNINFTVNPTPYVQVFVANDTTEIVITARQVLQELFLEIKEVLVSNTYEVDAWVLTTAAVSTFFVYLMTIVLIVYGFRKNNKCMLCKMRLNAKSKDKAILTVNKR